MIKAKRLVRSGLGKALSVVVALAMVMTVIPMAAMAAGTEEKIDLGTPIITFNFYGGNGATNNIAEMTDGDPDTAFTFNRNNTNVSNEKSWIHVAVYDAGENKTFDFNTIEAVNRNNVHYYGTNSVTNGEYDLNKISEGWGQDPELNDEKKNCSDDDEVTNSNRAEFAQRFGLTHIADIVSGKYESPIKLSYRYFVVIFGAGWPTTSSNELTLSLGDRHFTDELIGQAGEPLYDMSTDSKPTSGGDSPVKNYLGDGWTVKSNDSGEWNDSQVKFVGGNLNDHSANVKSYNLQTGGWGAWNRPDDDLQNGETINVLQFWSGKTSSEYYISAEKDKADSSEEKDYYVFEFYPSSDENGSGYLGYGDLALFDDSHNLITSFRYGMSDDAAISPFRSFAAEDAKYGGDNTPYTYELAGTDDNMESVRNGWRVRRNKKIRIVVTNDRESNSHTVKWYYKGGVNDDAGTNTGYLNKADQWTYFFGATYKNAVDGLGKIEAYRISQSTSDNNWRHIGIGNLKVYGGNYTNGEEAYSLTSSYRASLNAQPELPNTVQIGETTYTVNWPYVDTSSSGAKEVTGVIIETGRKIKATVNVGDIESYLTHYYDFNGNTENKGSTGDAGDGVLVGDAKIYENKLLINRNDRSKQDYMKINNAIVEDGQEQVTITAFFRPSINQSANPLFGFGTDENKRVFYNYNNGSKQMFEARAVGGFGAGALKSFDFGNSALINSWHHIAIVIDGDHVTTYYNGSHVGEHTFTRDELSAPVIDCIKGTDNYIGTSGYSSNVGWAYTGYIDDVRVYNTALHADEIAEIAAARPEEDDDLIAIGEPTLEVVDKSDETNAGKLYVDYKIDFSGVKQSNVSKTLHYYVTVNQFDNDTKEIKPVGEEQEVTVDENGVAAVGLVPENSNVIYGISARASVESDNFTSVQADASKAATLYELVLGDLADGGYAAGQELDQARLDAANAVIGKGGLAAFDSLDDVRKKIMTAAGNTVTINTPFKELGLGFLYKNGGLYVGADNTVAEGAEEGAVYQKLTLDGNKVTLEDRVGATGQEAVTLTLDAVQIEFVQTLVELLEAETASAELGIVPEL